MRGRATSGAAGVLTEVARGFERLGYRTVATSDALRLQLVAQARPTLLIGLAATGGRVFGGTLALEVSSAETVFPQTSGVAARGRGVVRLKTVDFRGRRDDPRSARLAHHLRSDRSLIDALSAVHFERVRVDPDGRPVIRHMGGSLVWLLFPPMIRPIPLVPDQVSAIVAAMEAFVRAGEAMGAGSA